MVNNFKLIPNLDLSHNYQIQQMLELFNTDNLTRRHIERNCLFIDCYYNQRSMHAALAVVLKHALKLYI